MKFNKKKGGNCNELLSSIIPLKNISINSDINTLISNRNVDDLISVLSGSKCSETIQENSTNLDIDTTTPADYLYINSRGGYKKMAKGGSSCGSGACNNCMKGGCFTCNKGKRKLNVYYKEIIVIIPVLYAKYKQFDKKKGKKMKGGYGSFMENIMNVTNLSFEYKPFSPVNFSDQLQDI